MASHGVEFVAEYRDLLAQLKRNEKRDINVLSMLAEDNKQHAAAVVDAIEQHILVAPSPVKLPALYVLDSISKNVSEPYTSLFARSLPEVFGAVWDSMLPDKRAPLSRLFATWGGVFPADVLDKVKRRMASSGAPAAPQFQPAQSQVVLQQQPLQVVQVPRGYNAPTPTVVALPPGATATLLGRIGGAQQVVSLSAPQVVSIPASSVQVQYFPMQQPVQVPYTLPMQQPQPVPVTLQALPPSPAHPTWQQQPQPQQVMLQQPPPPPRQRSPSPMGMVYSQQQPPPPPAHLQQQQQQGQQQQTGAAPIMSTQLSDLLSSLAQAGVVKAAPAAAAGRSYNKDDPVLKTTEMTPAYIKEEHEGVIAVLAEVSVETRGTFLDLAFLRKQRQRSGGASSRSWYVTIDHWLTGTVAATEAAQAFGGEEDEEAAAKEAPALEPEDPSQPCCAISGEPFDKVYDQEKEGWFYKGARRLSGEEAAQHGVPEGAIVKTSALADASHGPGGAGMGAELDASGLAAEIAAAAAGAQTAAGAEAHEQAAAAAGAGAQGGGVQQQQLGGGQGMVGVEEKKVVKSEEDMEVDVKGDVGVVGIKREAVAAGKVPEVKRQRAQ